MTTEQRADDNDDGTRLGPRVVFSDDVVLRANILEFLVGPSRGDGTAEVAARWVDATNHIGRRRRLFERRIAVAGRMGIAISDLRREGGWGGGAGGRKNSTHSLESSSVRTAEMIRRCERLIIES